MAGVVPTTATMTDRLTLGYRSVRTASVSPFGPAGLELRGHEFHYSTVSPQGDGLPSARSDGPRVAGWTTPDLFASYLHLHLGAMPALATELVTSAARTARRAARQ
jgi:cobyrinic acid a,c-diamide synthase